MTLIHTIYVHCSDTPNARPHTAEDIHRWHSDPKPLGNGWDGIGYHYVIQIDGTREAGRPHYWQGAHVGSHNDGTLGICLIGRDFFSNGQHQELEDLLRELREQYPNAKIRGHYEADPGRTCPNINMPLWLKARGIERK